jgi:hypothetical protein
MAESRAVQGYVDPNFPNPMTESSASIIIYGYVPRVLETRDDMLTFLIDTHLLSPLESLASCFSPLHSQLILSYSYAIEPGTSARSS